MDSDERNDLLLGPLDGYDCIFLEDEACTLLRDYPNLVEKIQPCCMANGKCGVLEGGECPAQLSEREFWTGIRNVASDFINKKSLQSDEDEY